MDLKARADLVRELRFEIKQRQRRDAPPRQLTSDEQRDQNFTRWLRSADRRRPRLNRNSTDEDRRTIGARVSAYESDPTRRGGFQVGERLREMYRDGRADQLGSEARSQLVRRMNRTGTSIVQDHPGTQPREPLQPNTITRTLTPSDFRRTMGAHPSRRRSSVASRAAADAAYPAPGRPGHEALRRRHRESLRRERARNGDVGAIVQGWLPR